MKQVLFVLTLIFPFIFCMSQDIKGIWIGSNSINQKGDLTYLPIIYDFYSQDSLYIESMHPTKAPQTVPYKLMKDTIDFFGEVKYNYEVKNDELHIIPIKDVDDEDYLTRVKRFTFLNASVFAKDSNITPKFLSGPFSFESDLLGTDTIEFINDTTYLQRNEHGYKEPKSWKLHQRRDNIKFIEWWNEYSDFTAFIMLPQQKTKRSFNAIMHYNKDAKINFTKLDTDLKKPNIKGVWKVDSIVRTFNKYFSEESPEVIKGVDITVIITANSIQYNELESAYYFSDYTGTELLLKQKKKDEDGEYVNSGTYKITNCTDKKLVFDIYERSSWNFFHDILYLSKKN